MTQVSKFVLSDYSSEENDLSNGMLNLKIKRHLEWANCVCFLATLRFFLISVNHKSYRQTP